MYSRRQIEKNIILLALSGSRAYRTNTEESDYDWRGIMIRPIKEDYLRYEGFEQKDSGWLDEEGNISCLSEDTVVWDLKKYLQLANKSNPNILEVLWHDHYQIINPIGKQLVSDRNMFITRNVVKTYKGYAYSQLKKLDNPNQTLPRVNDRKAGYRCKHAMHCLRLLYQLHYLFLKGELVISIDKFSKKQNFLLKKIKNGDVELDYIQKSAEDMISMLDKLDFSIFPKPLSEQKLSDYFIELLNKYYKYKSTYYHV